MLRTQTANEDASMTVTLDDASYIKQTAEARAVEFDEIRPKRNGAADVLNARLAARLNASSVSDEEHLHWLEERQVLIDKKFANSLSPAEEARLEYVRWSLDRIEDAKYGHTLDALELEVTAYEDFSSDLEKFLNALKNAKRKG